MVAGGRWYSFAGTMLRSMFRFRCARWSEDPRGFFMKRLRSTVRLWRWSLLAVVAVALGALGPGCRKPPTQQRPSEHTESSNPPAPAAGSQQTGQAAAVENLDEKVDDLATGRGTRARDSANGSNGSGSSTPPTDSVAGKRGAAGAAEASGGKHAETNRTSLPGRASAASAEAGSSSVFPGGNAEPAADPEDIQGAIRTAKKAAERAASAAKRGSYQRAYQYAVEGWQAVRGYASADATASQTAMQLMELVRRYGERVEQETTLPDDDSVPLITR